MDVDEIWTNFSNDIADIVLYQRETKQFSLSQLEEIRKQEKIFDERQEDKKYLSSHHNMFFTDYRNGVYITYNYKEVKVDERIKRITIKKNRDYQCLMMEAYEKFEDAIEHLYAYLGKNDVNFWPLSDYGEKKYKEILNLDFSFYLDKASKRKGGAIAITKSLIDRFQCNDYFDIGLKSSIILLEKIRHVIVHKRGIVDDKKKFIELIAKECGVYNNGCVENNLCARINYFFGSGKYENFINLTEERIESIPLCVEKCRFSILLDAMLYCVYTLCGDSKKHIHRLAGGGTEQN